jgi:ribulose-phosphate 3-epimerase
MVELLASLLSADWLHLQDTLSQLKEAGVDGVHFDVMDAHFVENLSFGHGLLKQVCSATTLPVTVHLMVSNPLQLVEKYCVDGVQSVTVHCEAGEAGQAIDKIKSLGFDAGAAIKPKTGFARLDGLDFDSITVMSVEPGRGGRAFIKNSAGRVFEASRLCDNVLVDGGITLQTGGECVEAGATALVTGSYLFSRLKGTEEDKELVEKFRALHA